MIYFSDFGNGFTAGDGALAYRNASASTGASAGAEPLANESYDRSGYHDNSTNNERLTIPSGVSLVRVAGTLAVTTGALEVGIRKGGASFAGAPFRSVAGTAWAGSVKTGPIAVSAGDYFELWKENSGSQTFNANYNSLSVEVLNPSLSYAMVNKTGTQSIPGASVTTAITFDNDVANVGGGWHSTSSNTSRLTVPVGVTRVRVTGGAKANASTTGAAYLITYKNGVSNQFVGEGVQSYTGTSAKGLNVATAIVNVTGGTDYFELAMINVSAMTVGSDYCWASIEDCSTTVACLVKRSSSQAISATTWTKVQWNAEEFDDASIHDNVTDNTRLTVPSGYTQARVSFCIQTASTEVGANVLMNNTLTPGMPCDWNNGLANGAVNGLSAWVDVVPGDYFEVEVFCNTATNVTNDVINWACLEVR